MSEQIKMIAARMRELREIAGYSYDDVASMLNISKEVYIAYENAAQDIPIGFLNEFANRFNVDLTELLTGKSPKLTRYSLVRSGKGVNVDRRAPYKYQSLAYNFINKKAEPFLVTVLPNNHAEVSMNSHPGQEFNYVVEGTLMIVIDGKEFILNKGDSIYFDSSLPHGMKALDNQAAEFLAIIL
ncbi:MAG: helix-turn-helix transcriptional regulator [Clostridiaceae bacterium]|mgnify:CR=1 FL=1|nr:helix-turn-helix transcriptional regulator [Clostridiaceae bacterium]